MNRIISHFGGAFCVQGHSGPAAFSADAEVRFGSMLLKKDFALSNNDSRSRAIAQSRFKNPLSWIRSFQILIPQFFCGDFFNNIGHSHRFGGLCGMSALPRAHETVPGRALEIARLRRRIACRNTALEGSGLEAGSLRLHNVLARCPLSLVRVASFDCRNDPATFLV